MGRVLLRGSAIVSCALHSEGLTRTGLTIGKDCCMIPLEEDDQIFITSTTFLIID